MPNLRCKRVCLRKNAEVIHHLATEKSYNEPTTFSKSEQFDNEVCHNCKSQCGKVQVGNDQEMAQSNGCDTVNTLYL